MAKMEELLMERTKTITDMRKKIGWFRKIAGSLAMLLTAWMRSSHRESSRSSMVSVLISSPRKTVTAVSIFTM